MARGLRDLASRGRRRFAGRSRARDRSDPRPDFDIASSEPPPIDADLLHVPAGPGAIHVERYGHGGAAIVLLHGFPTCSFLWRNVAPSLAIASRTAFALDLLGYGESDRPFGAAFGIAAQAEYVNTALGGLRIASATVVGVDLGGAVALRLAASHPERVDRLVLVNPIALDRVPADDVEMLQRATARFAVRVARGTLGAAPLLGEILRASVARPENMPDRLVARYLAPFAGREGLEHLYTLSRAIDAADTDEIDLTQLEQPTLIVWGDQDRFVPPRLGDRLASAIPGSRLVRIATVGRLVPEEASEPLALMILEFVGAGTLV